MKINNYDEIHDELVEIMISLDVEMYKIETDIYLYVDEEGNGELYQFENPGGNSWLDDDHIILYTDLPHYDDFWPDDEDGNPIPEEEYRNYLEEFRTEYIDRAYMLLEEAEIEPV